MSSSNPKQNTAEALKNLQDFGKASNSKAYSIKGNPVDTGNVFMGPKESRESQNMHYLNKKASHKDIGTIFMGPKENRESTLDQLLNSDQTHLWTKNTEEEYLNRVKEKALVKVKSLLTKAEERAQAIIQEAEEKAKIVQKEAEQAKNAAKQAQNDAQNALKEAENIKAQAYDEGLNEGLHQAQISLNQAKSDLSSATAYILMSIHEQCITIFDSWRKDLSELLLESVETATGYILDNNKTQILQALLEQGVAALLDKREYQIRVHPNDAGVLTELLEEMHKDVIQSRRWTLTSDDTLEEGTIFVESPSGLIKNSMNKRESFVKDILQNLTLPLGDGDQIAYDTITHTFLEQAQKANIPLNNENSQEQAVPESQDSPLQEEALHNESDSSISQEAQNMVESELDFSAEEMASNNEPPTSEKNIPSPQLEDAPQEVQVEAINAPSAEDQVQENHAQENQGQNKTEYTEELADELLDEMGFK